MSQHQQNQESLNTLDLLRMVAPERSAELEDLWQKYAPYFFGASDRMRFILEANPIGFVQYSNRTLLQVWLLGWVMWKEMYCWSTFIWLLENEGKPFVLAELDAVPDQKQSYANADALYSKAMEFVRSDPMDWILWPSLVPKPLDISLRGNEDWLIKDLVHHAIAFFLLHEVRHLMLHKDSCTFVDRYEEEFECDRWATEYLLAYSDAYAQASGGEPIKVKSKRAMGVALGKAVIAHVQELGLWDAGEEHPPVSDRMKLLVDRVDLPGNDYFWNVACSFLLASLRRQHALPDRVDFKEQRELFTKLLCKL